MDHALSRTDASAPILTWRSAGWPLVALFTYELITIVLFYAVFSLETHQVMPYANPWNSTVANGTGMIGVVLDEWDWQQAEYSAWLPWISCVTVSILGIAVALRIVKGHSSVALTAILVFVCFTMIFAPLLRIITSPNVFSGQGFRGIAHLTVLTIASFASCVIQVFGSVNTSTGKRA